MLEYSELYKIRKWNAYIEIYYGTIKPFNVVQEEL